MSSLGVFRCSFTKASFEVSVSHRRLVDQMLGSSNSAFVHPRPQRARIYSEDLGRALLAMDHPIGLVQSPEDVMALDIFKRINRLLECTMRLKHGIIDIRDRTAGENHSPLDDVLQFPHVSRPVVVREALHRLL